MINHIKRFSYLVGLIFFGYLTLSLLSQAQSDEFEKILNYASRIEVHQDRTMTVTENITVRCLGQEIKRGIYRDFPTKYRDRFNNRYVVEFNLLDIRKNGFPEPYHTESISNGIRIYIGKEDVFLTPGIYTYTITYQTNRQLGFFSDHDELYWNVTGTGWKFMIDTVTATVILPAKVRTHILETDAYTGFQGEKGKDCTVSTDPAGNPTFRTTRQLCANEGLTIVVCWKKGLIEAPSAQLKFKYFIKDNFGILFAFVGLILIVIYYLIIWGLFGKDPVKGTIIPQYYPPKGLSPAAVRYITKMGFDTKAFTATILNLAVKGYLSIEEKNGVYTLRKRNNANIELTPEEQKIVMRLFKVSDEFTFTATRHTTINELLQTLKNHLQLNYEKLYFLTNFKYFIVGLSISILIALLTAIPTALAKGGESIFLLLFMTVWLSGWTVGVIFLVVMVVTSWKNVLFGSMHRVTSLISAIFFTFFSLPFIGGEIAGIYMFSMATSGWFVLYLIILAGLNYLFYHLLKAPTRAGRQVLDKIEGFKMFLTIAEKERLNVFNPVGKTPEVFEQYLPYALALDVEQAWAEQFANVLTKSTVDGKEYSPRWYSGSIPFTAIGTTGFVSSMSNGFSNAVASSSHAPGSSSGSGGGGSSGGGGGGGGGGGW
ncbi:MAG: DUF2207 domain-containing protein [bacterium]|nr:DUF2207 domain-containing protein [bacterium]